MMENFCVDNAMSYSGYEKSGLSLSQAFFIASPECLQLSRPGFHVVISPSRTVRAARLPRKQTSCDKCTVTGITLHAEKFDEYGQLSSQCAYRRNSRRHTFLDPTCRGTTSPPSSNSLHQRAAPIDCGTNTPCCNPLMRPTSSTCDNT